VVTASFERLDVYKLAERLSDLIWEITSKWHWLAKKTVGCQLIRAADSIGANIAEGCGRWNYGDNKRFVRIGRGSLFETKHWLRRAYRRNLLTPEQITQVKSILDELIPRLNAYLKSIGQTHRPPEPPPMPENI
jgi:four helix bundle protein